MEDNGEEDKVITYTDLVGTLMSSVTTIVDMISYVLIAFVSISLVVSSIMIGVNNVYQVFWSVAKKLAFYVLSGRARRIFLTYLMLRP